MISKKQKVSCKIIRTTKKIFSKFITFEGQTIFKRAPKKKEIVRA